MVAGKAFKSRYVGILDKMNHIVPRIHNLFSFALFLELFIFDIVMTTYGYFTTAIISSNRWVWLFGFILTRISIGQNSVRMTYLIKTTAPEHRYVAQILNPLRPLLGN